MYGILPKRKTMWRCPDPLISRSAILMISYHYHKFRDYVDCIYLTEDEIKDTADKARSCSFLDV